MFDGVSSFPRNFDYGENDFLLVYDNTYYYQFRQFKTQARAYHHYKFCIEKSDSGMIACINIQGFQGMKFNRKMNLVSEANNLRCNVPKEDAGIIYNMKELIDK